MEHQDLSKKELLVQSNGQKAKTISYEGEGSLDQSDNDFFETNKSRKDSAVLQPPLKKRVKKSKVSVGQALAEL